MGKKFSWTLARTLSLFIMGLLLTMWLVFGGVLVLSTAQDILSGSYQEARERANRLRTSSFLNAYDSNGEEDWWIQYSYQHPVDGIVYPSTNRNTGRYTEYTLVRKGGEIKASTAIGIRLNQASGPANEGIVLLLDGLSAQDLFSLSRQMGPLPLSAAGTRDGFIFHVDTLTVGERTYYSARPTGGTDTIAVAADEGMSLDPRAYTLFPELLSTLRQWEIFTEAASMARSEGGIAHSPHYLGSGSLRRYLWSCSGYDTELYPNQDPGGEPLLISTVILSTPLKTALEEHTSVLFLTLALVPLLGLLFSRLMDRLVAAPLNQTRTDFQRVAALDFRGCEGDIRRLDEIGDLNRNIRAMAQELKRRWDDERALEARRQEFVAAASHELKTPLALMAGYTEAIAQGVGNKDRHLAAMEGEIQRMNGLVMELLDRTRLERMDRLSNPAPVDLSALLGALLEQTVPLFSGLDLQVSLEPGVHLSGDSLLLERAAGNLLSNAARYCLPGGVVTITLAPGPILCVENDAAPIPEEELPRLFEPFFRGDKARDRSGSGMGLAIAQKIFVLHHLECRAESRNGRFRLTVSPASPS